MIKRRSLFKGKRWLSVFLVIVMLASGALFSFAEPGITASEDISGMPGFEQLEFEALSGFSTIITDIYGKKKTFSGVLDVDNLETHACVSLIASYEIFCSNKSLLSVELHDVEADLSSKWKNLYSGSPLISQTTNGYYSVEFDVNVDETPCKGYITGLTNSSESGRSIADIQQAIIDNVASGELYTTTEDFDFIDAEKIEDSGEDSLCWAAATSNILHYTGWAAKSVSDGTNKDYLGKTVSLANEDDIFDTFSDAFLDYGGNTQLGLNWFFNGLHEESYVKSDSAAYEYGCFTGFLPNYSSNQVQLETGASCTELDRTFELLRAGNGVVVSVGWYLREALWTRGYTERSGGHAITLWGYIIDPSKAAQDPARYKKIIYSDSDDDKDTGTDRSLFYDRLGMATLEYETHYIGSTEPVMMWRLSGYESYSYDTKAKDLNGLLNGFYVLLKYDDSIPRESSGSKNLFTNINLVPYYSVVNNDYNKEVNDTNYMENSMTVFSKNDNIGLSYGVLNFSGNALSCNWTSVANKITLYKGDSVYNTYTQYYSFNSFPTDSYSLWDKYIGKLDPGEYTLKIELNTNRSIAEAYYSDNVRIINFTVLGDYYETAAKSGSNVTFRFIPEAAGAYVVAGYSTDGKMIGAYIFDSASNTSENSHTFTNASEMSTVKIFPVSSGYAPAGEVKNIAVTE